MPSFINAEPQPPSVKGRLIDECIAFGKQQWQPVWRAWSAQWSQPALIKLATETLGQTAIHSSQIAGFGKGTLRDPSPKLLLAIGELNLALARSNGAKGLGAGRKCPGVLAHLWEGYRYLQTPEGAVMGPLEVTAALMGLIDLQVSPEEAAIPAGACGVVCGALGSALRLHLGKQGIDYLEETYPAEVEALLRRHELPPAETEAVIPLVAELMDTTKQQLWISVVQPLLSFRR